MNKILDLAISYPDFQLNQIIDPEQVDLNNFQIVEKINRVIDAINTLTQGTTGASEISINLLPDFPTATSVQKALEQIAAYCKSNNTSINEIIAKNTEQDGRLNAIESLNSRQDTRLSAIEAKNTEQDGRISANERKNIEQDNNIGSMISEVYSIKERTKNLEDTRYTKREIDNQNAIHKQEGHSNLYYKKSETYSKEEFGSFLKGGDTSILYEVFTIVNPNNEDGTFTYADNYGNSYIGQLTETNGMIFELKQGFYNLGLNRIEITINDTLTRSLASGGIKEVDETHFELTTAEAQGTEITAKYYQRIDLQGQYQVYVGKVEPSFKTATLWIKELG